MTNRVLLIAALAVAWASTAHAETLQVSVSSGESSLYVLSLADTDDSSYSWPVQATIGTSGELEVNRDIVDGDVRLCARFRKDSSSSWNKRCTIGSGNNGNNRWMDGWNLTIITTSGNSTPPHPEASTSAPSYAASWTSCPPGDDSICVVVELEMRVAECYMDSVAGLTCYYWDKTVEIVQCSCIPDDDGESPVPLDVPAAAETYTSPW